MRVTGLDHLVLRCRDVEASLHFYGDMLGLDTIDADRWRAKEVFFPSVRIDDTTIIDLLEVAPEGCNVDHFCLVIEPTDLAELAARDDLEVVEGPVQRGGAGGVGWSVYVRDPDGHLVELKQYGVDASGSVPD